MKRSLKYIPTGTCSKLITVDVDDNTIIDVAFAGGCHGNTQGLSALLRGMDVDEAIRRLEGIDCHGKGTSCPDQLAKALQSLR